MCNTLQIIGVKQEGNVLRQANPPQGTMEPTNGFWARAIIDWGPLPTNDAEHLRICHIGINIEIFENLRGYHLNT